MDPGSDQPVDDRTVVFPPAEFSAHEGPARPLRVWTVFAVFIATALVSIAAQIPVVVVLVVIHVARGGKPQEAVDAMSTPLGFVVAALPAQLAILAMWWLASSYGDPRARAYRAIGRASLAWSQYACLAWGTLAVLWLGGLLGEAGAWLFGDWESEYFARIFESMTWSSGLVFVLFITLAPAFVEELFFRGYMQRRLLARLSPAVAIPLAAVVFAAFHGTPTWALTVLPMGLWLGILAWRTGLLWPGIVCHAFINGSVNLWRLGGAMDVLPEEMSPPAYYVGLATSLACVVLSCWILRRQTATVLATRSEDQIVSPQSLTLFISFALYQFFSALPFLRAESDASAPIEVGPQKQLFLDDYLVASTTNIYRRIHPAEKSTSNPVIRQTDPWEDPLNILYGSVIRDGEKYKSWYKSGPGVSYAESDDGIHWVKPPLDLVPINGAKTNILFRKNSELKGSEELPYYHELFGVHKDEREPDPSRRYKMGYLSIDWEYKGPREGRFREGQRRGLGIAASPDGIHWKLIDSFASEAICDGATHWMFDPALGKYVLYGRTLKTPPEIEAAWRKYDWYPAWYSGRAVGRLESSDFMHWNFTAPFSSPVVMTADLLDKPGTEIYSVLVFPYESVYIGLVQTLLAVSDVPAVDVQLAVSRDGVHFARVGDGPLGGSALASRAPFLPNGPVGSWDRFNQSLASNPPIAEGDELRFYYAGRTYRHAPYDGKDSGPRAGCIGLATIERDRFVSLDASFDGGEVLTERLKLNGKRLHLNAESEFGEINVEAINATGQSIARSKPIRCDSLDTVIEWEGGEIEGAVVLRITLRNARLYALWCD